MILQFKIDFIVGILRNTKHNRKTNLRNLYSHASMVNLQGTNYGIREISIIKKNQASIETVIPKTFEK